MKPKPDWNALRSEYIAGGISQRKLAEKYGVAYTAIRRRAETDGWVKEREEVTRRCVEEASRKSAEAAASNAVLLEKARALAIRRIIRALEEMPEDGGSHVRESEQIGKGAYRSVDHDLLELVTALEKLGRGDAGEAEEKVTIVWGR